jgi:hypothetical protein
MPDSSSNDCRRAHAVRVRPALVSVRSLLLLALACSVVLASIPCARRVVAAETRVAFVDPTANVLDAVTVALSPWGLRVVSVSAPTPPTELGPATTMAREVARDHDASAVVWVAPARGGGGASLWLFDSQTAQTMIRPLSQSPPFDDASAAALALTVKTLLRSTTVAPVQERVPEASGTSSASAPSTAPSASSGSVAPATSGSSGPPPLAPSAAILRPETGPQAAPHAWRAEALVMVRVPTGAEDTLAPRAALAISWWPPAWREHLGFGLEGRAGTSLDVTSPRFAGSFSDTGVGLTVRGAVAVAPLWLEVDADPSLQVTSLTGAEIATGLASSIMRADPSFDLALVPQLALGARLRLGLFVGLEALLRTQRYVLDGDVVLRVPPLVLDLGGRASLALD